jgi:hypothetical protein
MPLPSVHFLIARIPLLHWLGEPTRAPFDVTDAAARNAYFQGALAPDMGLFPGGKAMLSELAHGVHGSALARALVVTARTDVQRAFALGWATHMMTDDMLHPAIDSHAARLVARAGGAADDHALLAVAHVRAELGLDVFVHARNPEVRALRLRPCFDALSIRYLADAYRATYGLSLNGKWLLRSHRVVGPLAAALGLLERIHARACAERTASRALSLIRRIFGTRLSGQSAAFLHPVHPPRRLLAALGALQYRFSDPDSGPALGCTLDSRSSGAMSLAALRIPA